MPLGQSVPVSGPLALVAGVIAGELARQVVRALDGGEAAQRIATGVGHGLVSLGVGYAVNLVLGVDATGAVVTTGQTALSAAVHAVATSASPLQHPSGFSAFET